MASEQAIQLKHTWADMPDEHFEPLTFGELPVGASFIGMPLPGDNQGHGGFRGSHRLFRKTEALVAHSSNGIPYAVPTGNAVAKDNGWESSFPHSMTVIRIDT